ncbi:MAG: hypothetical protein IPP51_14370 [Bacteroidetes bacterium]|nr:hypothetical protein [Bacteroidota bacterium]
MKKLFSLSVLMVAFTFNGLGQSTGPIVPSGYATSGSGASWGNLSGIQSVDNNPAYADLAQYPTCNNFLCYHSNLASFTNFAFAIPTSAIITGIKLDILQRVNSPGGGIHDSILVLALNGNPLGVDRASALNWYDTPTIQTYGDSTDTWGYAWTPTELNDPNFGFQYMLTNTSYDQAASVDQLAMTVYYDLGNGITSQTSAPWQIGFAGNELYVNAPASQNYDKVQVLVSTITGELVYQSEIGSNNKTMELKQDVSALE